MPRSTTVYHADPPEISLFDIWTIIVQQKLYIVFIGLIFSLVALTYCLIVPKEYAAKVLMEPVSVGGEDQKASGLGQLSALQGLSALPLGMSATSKHSAMAVFSSQQFLGAFLAQEKILPDLYPDRFDPATKQWQEAEPTPFMSANLFLKKVMSLTEDRNTGLVTLSIRWVDRNKAVFWANTLVERINKYLREVAIQEAQSSLEYLKQAYQKTDVIALHQAITKLLESQMQKVMLANIRKEYAFKVLDAALLPPKGSYIHPRPIVYPLLSFLIGLCVAGFQVVISHFSSVHRARKERLDTKAKSVFDLSF
ncbi:MAG: hypothetical protein HQL54_12725 [Magnetococcales bacterium]|nr:hypothetical protein [Magnetococcales bacterium]